jgi:hypothetical protein
MSINRELTEFLEKKGFFVQSVSTGKHPKAQILGPYGVVFTATFSKTPSDHRSRANQLTLLKRLHRAEMERLQMSIPKEEEVPRTSEKPIVLKDTQLPIAREIITDLYQEKKMLVSKDYKDSSFWYFNQKGSFTTTTGIPKRIGDYLIQEKLITYTFLNDRFVWILTEKGMQKAEKLLTIEAPKEEPTSLPSTVSDRERNILAAMSHLSLEKIQLAMELGLQALEDDKVREFNQFKAEMDSYRAALQELKA